MINNKDNKTKFNYELLTKEGASAVATKILERLEKGMTLKDATGISDQSLEEIYSLAYGYYNQGKYKESASLFQFLASCSPNIYKFVLGLASSYHQLGIYQEAVAGFYIALEIEPDNPIPAYYITDCFLKQGLYEEAAEVTEVTIFICENRPEFRDLKNRCELIQRTLKEKNNKLI
ncbi:MAG: SycD/LcrH family type III secretion system chaperone [Chlamydiales bacterium]|nr:SycD/LcrH family type III secretion system chaperone [Chlamydiales bacterium]